MDYSTVSRLQLDSWSGSGGWFADKDSGIKSSDGTFEIYVSLVDVPGGGDDEDRARIRKSESFAESITYQIEHQGEIYSKIIDAAKQEYKEALADKDAYDLETVETDLPSVNNQDDLKALIRPDQLHIGFTSEMNVEYVGYAFECSWDEEHGFGVRLHDLEIEEFGYADVCF